MNDIKPVPTKYNGVKFRSRLEARWAVLFDGLSVKWIYEPEAYSLGEEAYLPDFLLPEFRTIVEIRPWCDCSWGDFYFKKQICTLGPGDNWTEHEVEHFPEHVDCGCDFRYNAQTMQRLFRVATFAKNDAWMLFGSPSHRIACQVSSIARRWEAAPDFFRSNIEEAHFADRFSFWSPSSQSLGPLPTHTTPPNSSGAGILPSSVKRRVLL